MKTKNMQTITSFSLKEKLYAQFTFHAGVLTGSYGLSLNSTSLGIAYLINNKPGQAIKQRPEQNAHCSDVFTKPMKESICFRN
ncbi:MAG: hypothetical protein PVG39_25380 [Desulfobacteraceae bacterium]|jgi:hypothetical protein